MSVPVRPDVRLRYQQKGYKLWDLSKGEVAVSRDVVFEGRNSSVAEY